MKDHSYLGSGELHLREIGAAAPFVSVGNVSALTFSPQTNTLTLADSTQPGGGERNRVDRLTGVEVAYTFHDFAPENFAIALRGSSAIIEAGDVVDESVVAYPGGLTPLARIATEIASVEATGGGAAYELGKDYELRNGALFIPATSGIPVPAAGAANILVSYSHPKVAVVQALVNPAKQYEALFLGLNEAQSGKPVRVHAHKLSGGVLAQMGLIGDEYGAGEVTGALMADSSKAAGLSRYFTVEQEVVA